jgi:hypothetical protein
VAIRADGATYTWPVTTPPRLPKPLDLVLALIAALALASCSQTDSAPSAPSSAAPSGSVPTPSGSAAPTSSPRASAGNELVVTVKGKQVTPAPKLVNLAVGRSLTIAVTSDHDNTLHAHGLDIEEKLTAGQQMKFTVKGVQAGVYDVELHDPELRLLQVAVR